MKEEQSPNNLSESEKKEQEIISKLKEEKVALVNKVFNLSKKLELVKKVKKNF